MKFRVLGCSGGIGGRLRTTSFVIDHDILIDAGTGVGELSLDQLSRINHVFITHTHMDHICSLPLLLDSVMGMRDRPVIVYASEAILKILKEHVFNWKIWPDFNEICNDHQPVMRYQVISLGEVINLQGRKIRAIPAVHTVPAVGYHIDSGEASLVFSGDTHVNEGLWKVVNKIENLRYLIMETAFSNAEEALAIRSQHLCPRLLVRELSQFEGDAELFITHLKPDEAEQIMSEIARCKGKLKATMLLNNQVFDF
ncbi:MAG: 3',5'-cyclic-nucleotide phosphodiesterase [Gallionella sp.]